MLPRRRARRKSSRSRPSRRINCITWSVGCPARIHLLVQRYVASNGAMLVGGELLTIDTANGAAADLNAEAPLGFGAAFAWAARPAGSAGAAGLYRLRRAGGGRAPPGPAGFQDQPGSLSAARWGSGERSGLESGQRQTGFFRPPHVRLLQQIPKRPFPVRASTSLIRRPVAVESLVASPPGAADNWPHWSADGQSLVYARLISPAGGSSVVQVRARRQSDGKDWLLVDGLPGPQAPMGR